MAINNDYQMRAYKPALADASGWCGLQADACVDRLRPVEGAIVDFLQRLEFGQLNVGKHLSVALDDDPGGLTRSCKFLVFGKVTGLGNLLIAAGLEQSQSLFVDVFRKLHGSG